MNLLDFINWYTLLLHKQTLAIYLKTRDLKKKCKPSQNAAERLGRPAGGLDNLSASLLQGETEELGVGWLRCLRLAFGGVVFAWVVFSLGWFLSNCLVILRGLIDFDGLLALFPYTGIKRFSAGSLASFSEGIMFRFGLLWMPLFTFLSGVFSTYFMVSLQAKYVALSILFGIGFLQFLSMSPTLKGLVKFLETNSYFLYTNQLPVLQLIVGDPAVLFRLGRFKSAGRLWGTENASFPPKSKL